MPNTIGPNGAQPYTKPLESISARGSDRQANLLRLRLRTGVHRGKLTRALAEGADPRESDELALRAQKLTSDRSRKALARTLRRSIAEAYLPAHTRARVSIIDRRGVLDAESAIRAMVERLLGPRPVHAQGMAMLERILTNADSSPLYNRSRPGTLRQMIRAATAALDRQAAGSHEFALAV